MFEGGCSRCFSDSVTERAFNSGLIGTGQACFKRRAFRVPNVLKSDEMPHYLLFLMRSAHEKHDV